MKLNPGTIPAFVSGIILGGLGISDHYLRPEPQLALQSMHDSLGRSIWLLTWSAAAHSYLRCVLILIFVVITAALMAIAFRSSGKKIQPSLEDFLDLLLSLPVLVIGLVLAGFMGSGPYSLVVACFIGTIPNLTKIFLSRLQSLENEDYFKASLSLGSSHFRSLSIHGGPYLLEIIKAQLPSLITRLFLLDASLSFIGAYQPSSQESLGQLIFEGRDYLLEAPWIALVSGFFLFATLYSLKASRTIKI